MAVFCGDLVGLLLGDTEGLTTDAGTRAFQDSPLTAAFLGDGGPSSSPSVDMTMRALLIHIMINNDSNILFYIRTYLHEQT